MSAVSMAYDWPLHIHTRTAFVHSTTDNIAIVDLHICKVPLRTRGDARLMVFCIFFENVSCEYGLRLKER